ncbi:hypothetical protein [Thioclava sp. GXIMD2076]|uniref:hypothetical protein n=1 Tax=Thioclava sp. GXIMD2076 TaxID=3131931 RepID=UPI0030D279A8
MNRPPNWAQQPPTAYSIVTGFFPEAKPEGGTAKCRPLLVMQVLQGKSSGKIALRVCYGTTKVKFPQRANIDLIIQNSSDLDACGLLRATRFVIDPKQQTLLEWNADNFCLWSGTQSPRRGQLPEHLQKEVAWLMMQHL